MSEEPTVSPPSPEQPAAQPAKLKGNEITVGESVR